MTGAAVACSVPMFVGSQAGSAANDIVGSFFVLAAAALFFDADEDAAFPLVLGGYRRGARHRNEAEHGDPGAGPDRRSRCPAATPVLAVARTARGGRVFLVPEKPNRRR